MGTESTDRKHILYTSTPSASGKVHIAKEFLREIGLTGTNTGIKEREGSQILNISQSTRSTTGRSYVANRKLPLIDFDLSNSEIDFIAEIDQLNKIDHENKNQID